MNVSDSEWARSGCEGWYTPGQALWILRSWIKQLRSPGGESEECQFKGAGDLCAIDDRSSFLVECICYTAQYLIQEQNTVEKDV